MDKYHGQVRARCARCVGVGLRRADAHAHAPVPRPPTPPPAAPQYVAALRELFEANRDKYAKGEDDMALVE